jgi:hypothetical protein
MHRRARCSGSSTAAAHTPARRRSGGSRAPGEPALTPNDFASRGELARLLRFGDHYRQIAQPFDGPFTRTDLDAVLAKITQHEPKLTLAA